MRPLLIEAPGKARMDSTRSKPNIQSFVSTWLFIAFLALLCLWCCDHRLYGLSSLPRKNVWLSLLGLSMISESAIENVDITDSNDQWRLSDAFLSEKASMQTMKRSLCKTLK